MHTSGVYTAKLEVQISAMFPGCTIPCFFLNCIVPCHWYLLGLHLPTLSVRVMNDCITVNDELWRPTEVSAGGLIQWTNSTTSWGNWGKPQKPNVHRGGDPAQIHKWHCPNMLQQFLHLYRASWYYQSLLFTNECTSDCLKKKNNIKIYIKIAPTCFGAVTPSSESK